MSGGGLVCGGGRGRRIGRRAWWLGLAATVLLAAACRPPIGEVELQSGETVGPAETPPPAVQLQPDVQTNVQLRLFRGLGPADAALLYGQALDSFREANLVADIAPPLSGYEPFTVESTEDTVTLWIGTVSDLAPSIKAGLELVAVGELSGRDPTVLVGPTALLPARLEDLGGQVVIAETASAKASLLAAIAAGGGDPAAVTVQVPEDPAAPFDPIPVLDGTAAAAVVSDFDGWARVQESLVLVGEDPGFFVSRRLRDAEAPLLGELVWAQRRDLANPKLRPAITALLGVLGQTQIACRDAVEDCAGVFAAQSDRTPEGLAWSIDQVNRTLFPAPDGILHIEPASWQRTVAAMQSAGIGDVDQLAYTNDLVDAVVAAIGSELDFTGMDWTPKTDLPLFP